MASPTEPLLQLQDLVVHYRTRQGDISAVAGVSFAVRRGEALGLVGESGCGKTTIALAVLKVLPDNALILGGQLYFDGMDLVPLGEAEMRSIRWKRISMVFQAAMSSLNPVYRVSEQVVEAILAHEPVSLTSARDRTATLFHMMGLDPSLLSRYPHELSGGMKQRVVIAMALACNPALVIADEPTTALDVVVQDRILKQLRELQRQTNITMVYISHDIAVIAETCHRIAVMYAGRLAELAEAGELFRHPLHPYSKALLLAFPSITGEKHPLASLAGEPPNLLHPPPACRFHPRCPYATAVCQEVDPEWKDYGGDHWAACWHPLLENAR